MENTGSLQQTNNSVSSAAAKFKSNQYKHPLIENIIKLNQMDTACGIITGMVMENKQPGEICDTLSVIFFDLLVMVKLFSLSFVVSFMKIDPFDGAAEHYKNYKLWKIIQQK